MSLLGVGGGWGTEAFSCRSGVWPAFLPISQCAPGEGYFAQTAVWKEWAEGGMRRAEWGAWFPRSENPDLSYMGHPEGSGAPDRTERPAGLGSWFPTHPR